MMRRNVDTTLTTRVCQLAIEEQAPDAAGSHSDRTVSQAARSPRSEPLRQRELSAVRVALSTTGRQPHTHGAPTP